MNRSSLLTVALALPAAASAQAFVNGGFEDPNLGIGNYSYTTQPTGWTGTGALINAQGASAWYGATPPSGQEGAQFYALQETSSVFENFTVARSGLLTVSWLAAGRPNFGSYGGDQSYDVSLTGSGIEEGSFGTFTTTSGQAFTRLTETGTVIGGQIYSLTFHGLSTSDETAFIDGVTVSQGLVPEAATWAMMVAGFGLVGSGMRRHRLARVVA